MSNCVAVNYCHCELLKMLFHKCCRCRTYSGIFIYNKQNVMNAIINDKNAAETESAPPFM